MANTFTPFGFLQDFGGSGGAPTFAQSERKIASGDSQACYFGDPVFPVLTSATGYVTQAHTPGTTVIAGIFVGCKYLSTSQKRVVWNRYWPGADATGDVTAYVIDDPNAQFLVQASGASFYNASWTATTMTSLPIGQYAQFSIGTGNTSTGQSGAYISSVDTTVTFPFIIRGLYGAPPGANGTNYATDYPYYVVGFNNEILRTNGAGPTGIS